MSNESNYLKNQNRFGFTVLNKSRKNEKVCSAIEEYLSERFEINNLPPTRSAFKTNEAYFYHFDSYGEALKDELDLLISFYYNIKHTRGYYAYFEKETENKAVPLAFWYSKHRLCAVWNWRKSQIIRQKYYSFLKVATDEHNRLLINHYVPIHLVLTVPHKDGFYKNSEFYAKELIEDYNALRKTEAFKAMIYGGEYGVEVKKSKEHGLHIHIHSFLLQNPEYSINETRYFLIKNWAKITDNEKITNYIIDYEKQNQESYFTGKRAYFDAFFKQLQKTKEVYSGINYESLYNFKNGQKEFINPKTATVEEYLGGVMECIKYHFKPDCLEFERGGLVDIELIKTILNNTKGKNLYNRFGLFRKVEELNFNIKNTGNDLFTNIPEHDDNLEDIDTKTTTETVESKIINPFTKQKSKRTDYQIIVGNPKLFKVRDLGSKMPYEHYLYRFQNGILFSPPNLTLKEVIKYDVQGKLVNYILDYQIIMSGMKKQKKRLSNAELNNLKYLSQLKN
ncbi:MAG: protein rep [Flavobacterium sp.]|nr:protein rep [Flavobacterium sp.]MCU0470240.1 protein rep [Arcicella sp.]